MNYDYAISLLEMELLEVENNYSKTIKLLDSLILLHSTRQQVIKIQKIRKQHILELKSAINILKY